MSNETTLFKNDKPLFTECIYGSTGMGYDEQTMGIGSTFCTDDIICATNELYDEQGNVTFKLPAKIWEVHSYAALPWVMLDNEVLINLITRYQQPGPLTHFGYSIEYMILSPCRACMFFKACGCDHRCFFLYKDVTTNLSALLGVLPVDVLNEMYRFIKG